MIEPVHGQVLTRRTWLKSSLSLLLASGTLARATEPGLLRVGFIANYEPFSFLKNDGRLAGFDVDAVEALLVSLGMQVQAVTASVRDPSEASSPSTTWRWSGWMRST